MKCLWESRAVRSIQIFMSFWGSSVQKCAFVMALHAKKMTYISFFVIEFFILYPTKSLYIPALPGILGAFGLGVDTVRMNRPPTLWEATKSWQFVPDDFGTVSR